MKEQRHGKGESLECLGVIRVSRQGRMDGTKGDASGSLVSDSDTERRSRKIPVLGCWRLWGPGEKGVLLGCRAAGGMSRERKGIGGLA